MPKERVHDDVVGHAEGGPEAPDIVLRPVLLTGLFIVVFTAATLAGIRWYKVFEIPVPNVETPQTFAPPTLQQNPEADLARMQTDQRRRLETYDWVDRQRGIARMPITEAMHRLADQGASAYAAPIQPEHVPSLGSRGGASGSLPSPDGRPGAVATPAGAQRMPGRQR